jgi:hypothetical protein
MKPRLVMLILFVLALAVPMQMLAQDGRGEKEIRAILDELKAANLKGGLEAVPVFDKYYADDYVRILTNGKIETKAAALDSFRTGTTKVESVEISDVRIRMYRKTAVVTGVVKAKGTSLGVANSPTGVRWTRVLIKRGGNWQCVLYQTTRIAELAKQ